MTIARYRKIENHPTWLYSVELLVQTNGKIVKIAEFNCASEQELKYATECCDYVLRGEAE